MSLTDAAGWIGNHVIATGWMVAAIALGFLAVCGSQNSRNGYRQRLNAAPQQMAPLFPVDEMLDHTSQLVQLANTLGWRHGHEADQHTEAPIERHHARKL